MSQYYLMSQLPSLDGISEATQLPITEKRFYELCNQLLDKKLLKILNLLTLIPSKDGEKTGILLLDLWNNFERQLRLALAAVRAEKMGKTFVGEQISLDTQILSMAKEAAEKDNPLMAEQYLNQIRLNYLESLRPMDNFSEEMIFYYGLRLKLILRIRRFDEENGNTAYINIYNSIMGKEKREVN